MRYVTVNILPSGEVVPTTPGLALGVYEGDRLKAVYLRNPSTAERRREVTRGFWTLAVGFIVTLAICGVSSIVASIIAVLAYLLVAALVLNYTIFDSRDVYDLDTLAKRVEAYYHGQVHLIDSIDELKEDYPLNEYS